MSEDGRVYVDLKTLMLMQHRTNGLSFLPTQPNSSLLSGRHASRIRGRGLNFEEIRPYRAGDDVRTIDWKVTARTRSAHARVFTEERDRPTLLVVDQRMSMFFGTKVFMKSVIAAKVAGLVAWRALHQGDRIGAIVFNDSRSTFIKPQRSRDAVTRILSEIVDFNHELNSAVAAVSSSTFGETIASAARLARHDFLVVVVSDFIGLDDACVSSLHKIAGHNDLIGVLVHDPSASNLPDGTQMVVSDGELQMELRPGRRARTVRESATDRLEEVLALQTRLQAPIFPLSTESDALPQLHRFLGHRDEG
ncbi:MAG: DUF58 domain-containing protein [Planctomycetota bacterium]